MKRPVHYQQGQGTVKSRRPLVLLVVAVLLLVTGSYLLFLVQSPSLPLGPLNLISRPQSSSQTDNFVEIPTLKLKVPFATGSDASVLDKGAWWRYPERGDPQTGGNFILSAHRFRLALTPWATRNSSPFYHLDQVKVGDTINVTFNGKKYAYHVTKLYSVPSNATQIEAPSATPKLTLYSCSLLGQADGRYVVEATPVAD